MSGFKRKGVFVSGIGIGIVSESARRHVVEDELPPRGISRESLFLSFPLSVSSPLTLSLSYTSVSPILLD